MFVDLKIHLNENCEQKYRRDPVLQVFWIFYLTECTVSLCFVLIFHLQTLVVASINTKKEFIH